MPDELTSEHYVDPKRTVPKDSEVKQEARSPTEQEIHINFGKLFVDSWGPKTPKSSNGSPKTNKNSPKKNNNYAKKNNNSAKKKKKKWEDHSNNDTLRQKSIEKSRSNKIPSAF